MAGPIRVTNLAGYAGGNVISDTTVTTPPARRSFVALHVITATVIDTVVSNLTGNGLNGAAVPAGAVIPGKFTSVKLTSGIVVAVLD